MTLIKFEPIKEFENIQSNLIRYFDDFPTFSPLIKNYFSPIVDISEKDNKIVINAEIPGVDKKDIKLTLQDNILTIEGEKKNEKHEKNKNYFKSERRYGSFKRSFTLPENVDSEKVDAKFENGILEITLKKEEIEKPKERVIKLK